MLLFDEGTDLLEARQLVQERVATVTPTLPTWAAPPVMLQPMSATSRVLKIGLSTTDPRLDLMDLSMTAYWKIRARLLRVPGVANVPIWGERLDMLQVQTDQKRMAAQNGTLDQVMNTTSDALDAGLLPYSAGHFIGRGGWVDGANQRTGVRHVLPIVTSEDMANLPIRTSDGRQVRLKDVANLVRDHQPLIGDAVARGAPGLFLVVDKFPGANTREVTAGVEKALADMAPGLKGITVDANVHRPATYIETALKNVGFVGLIGLAPLLGVMFLVMLPLVLLMKRPKGRAGPIAAH